MGGVITKILLVALAIWVIWLMLRPRYAFEIRIEDGHTSLRKGKVTRAYLRQVEVACQENGLVRGWIGGKWRGRRISLRFSRDFPAGLQQRLRNEWQLVG
jgi:hypothetical protein